MAWPIGFLFVSLLEQLRKITDPMFGTELCTRLYYANLSTGLPVTPKLHIISTHVIQWFR